MSQAIARADILTKKALQFESASYCNAFVVYVVVAKCIKDGQNVYEVVQFEQKRKGIFVELRLEKGTGFIAKLI